MNQWDRYEARRMIRAYEHRGWLSPVQRAELVDLLDDGMEATALRVLLELLDERSR